jgi:microsomal dipeptidase-like Zn-dependent dipeptidase
MHWEELHSLIRVVDLHAHPVIKATLLGTDLNKSRTRLLLGFISRYFNDGFWPFSNRVTFPKMQQGQVDALLSVVYILEQGMINDVSLIWWLLQIFRRRRRDIVLPSYFHATNAALDEMESQVNSSELVKLAKSPTELRAAIDDDQACIVHCIEGAHSLQGNIAGKVVGDLPVGAKQEILMNLEYFYNRGVAYLGLAHFYPNHCVHPVFPYPKSFARYVDWERLSNEWDETKGLSDIGVEVVEKTLDLGMLIDITHCTLVARKQIYDIVDSRNASQCLLATHIGASKLNDVTYNLHDWELEWFANHGCVVGIIFMNYWLSAVDSGPGLDDIERTLSHIINVCGTDAVGVGTDFDGFTDPPDEITDISKLPILTKYLKNLQYDDSVIEKFLGGNALRILLEGWK